MPPQDTVLGWFGQVGIGVATLYILWSYMRNQERSTKILIEALTKITELSTKISGESAQSQSTAITAMNQNQTLLERLDTLSERVQAWSTQLEEYNRIAATRTAQLNAIQAKVDQANSALSVILKGTNSQQVIGGK